MITYMHINQLTAMLTCIIGYPVFAYLASSSIKGFRKKTAAYPFVMPVYYPQAR
jgi:hypothetical protein